MLLAKTSVNKAVLFIVSFKFKVFLLHQKKFDNRKAPSASRFFPCCDHTATRAGRSTRYLANLEIKKE
jgi:hypothetical protein